MCQSRLETRLFSRCERTGNRVPPITGRYQSPKDVPAVLNKWHANAKFVLLINIDTDKKKRTIRELEGANI